MIGLGAGTIAAYGRAGDVSASTKSTRRSSTSREENFHFSGTAPRRSRSPSATPGSAWRATVAGVRSPGRRCVLRRRDPRPPADTEAMAVYLRHLKPDGVMAFHVTNHFLNLAPVVKQIAIPTVSIGADRGHGRNRHRLQVGSGAGDAQPRLAAARRHRPLNERDRRHPAASTRGRTISIICFRFCSDRLGALGRHRPLRPLVHVQLKMSGLA